MSKSFAALVGLIFATLMATWIYLSRDASFDEVMVRFAVYFPVFTIGFYLIVNFLVSRRK
jgi:apolipoprotein N-acyltransferase